MDDFSGFDLISFVIVEYRECPEELKEAIAGLLFAASRCGDFPELHEIKSVLTSRFGKEFTARAVELRNNCGVNHLVSLNSFIDFICSVSLFILCSVFCS